MGATAGGEKAKAMLDLHRPDLDFVALATGMGVPATRATTCEDFVEQLRAALATQRPHGDRGHRPVDPLRPGQGYGRRMTDVLDGVLDEAGAQLDDAVDLRRRIHEQPELG